MSERDHDGDRDHDHDYAVVARPYVQVRIRADTGDQGLDAFSVTIDYDRSGVSAPGEETDTAVDDRQDIEWRGLELAIYRDGTRLFDSKGSLDLDTSEVLGYVDDISIALGRLSRRLR